MGQSASYRGGVGIGLLAAIIDIRARDTSFVNRVGLCNVRASGTERITCIQYIGERADDLDIQF